jgi:hypothetical protein
MKYIIFLSLTFITITGCFKFNDNPNVDPGPIKLSAGFACGWGSGEDSLVIYTSAIKYMYWVPAQSREPKINMTKEISGATLDSILRTIDYAAFQKLNYNTCNICVDGCDEWITVYKGSESHRIRYSKGLKISSISALQDKLAEIRKEFGN